MQNSRLQLGLITALALCLGYSVASSDAIGYPAGAAVSYGANPVWSVGGNLSSGDGAIPLVSVDGAHDLVVTDVYVSLSCTNCAPRITLSAGGETLASYRYWQFKDGGGVTDSVVSPVPVNHALSSGLRVPAGESLSIQISSYDADYTLSGYYAQR